MIDAQLWLLVWEGEMGGGEGAPICGYDQQVNSYWERSRWFYLQGIDTNWIQKSDLSSIYVMFLLLKNWPNTWLNPSQSFPSSPSSPYNIYCPSMGDI